MASEELWDSKHCAFVVAAATAVAPLAAAVAQANDDKPDVEGPSNNLVSGSLEV